MIDKRGPCNLTVSPAIVNQVITIRSAAYPTRDGPHLGEEGNIPRSVRDSLSRAHARHSYDDSISRPRPVDRYLLIFVVPLIYLFLFSLSLSLPNEI